MAKRNLDDDVFKAVKTKLCAMTLKATEVDDVVALANTLIKMKAVELKMGEDEWGSGLQGGDKP